jgi:phage tail-like protein
MAVKQDEIKAGYPLPVYNYRVTIGFFELAVAEVAGLSVAYEPCTYKHGLSFAMGATLIPGMRQPTKLTLKRGVCKRGAGLYLWLRAVNSTPLGAAAQQNILIDLCDETGAPVVRWRVQGAIPVKIDAPAFDATSNEVAIETVELVAQDVSIEYSF